MALQPALRPEAGGIPNICGFHAGRQYVHSPASYRDRGALVRDEIEQFRRFSGRDLDADMIQFFCPNADRLCGHSIDWLATKLFDIASGKGCAQTTIVALMPIMWRLPRVGWPVWMPQPPFESYSFAFPSGIRRHDGEWISWPPKSQEVAQ